MKCVILAAGYATRLYPLTENFPKPLLKVGGKTILDWLVDDVDTAGKTDGYVVVTNHKFAPHFEAWAQTKKQAVTVVDDGTSTNETRLGAVCDLQCAIDRLGLDEELLVMAGDNLLDFSLSRFLRYAEKKQSVCVMRFHQPDPRRLQKSGVLSVDATDRITRMVEKPQHPESHWVCPPFYYYTREAAALVKEGIAGGCGTDAPGSFVAWLSARMPVYAMLMPGKRYDIGSLETYGQVCREYNGIIIPNTGKDAVSGEIR